MKTKTTMTKQQQQHKQQKKPKEPSTAPCLLLFFALQMKLFLVKTVS
jgi:type II secretory pathway component PulF